MLDIWQEYTFIANANQAENRSYEKRHENLRKNAGKTDAINIKKKIW